MWFAISPLGPVSPIKTDRTYGTNATHDFTMPLPLVIAHRGNSSAAPENTLSAFRSALRLGVDGVEFDYHHSADGVPVVFHDKTLDRTTNARTLWRRADVGIRNCSLAQLQELDYGGWFGGDNNFAGEPLATLDSTLDLICDAGALAVIERKSGDAETLVKLLNGKRLIDRVVVMAFDWAFLADCYRQNPAVRLVALGDGLLRPARLDEIGLTPAKIVGWDQRNLDSGAISAIHGRGWQAWTWTVDQPARIRELTVWGIDAITSNDPARVLEVLAE